MRLAARSDNLEVFNLSLLFALMSQCLEFCDEDLHALRRRVDAGVLRTNLHPLDLPQAAFKVGRSRNAVNAPFRRLDRHRSKGLIPHHDHGTLDGPSLCGAGQREKGDTRYEGGRMDGLPHITPSLGATAPGRSRLQDDPGGPLQGGCTGPSPESFLLPGVC
jgi:hypothetical protein